MNKPPDLSWATAHSYPAGTKAWSGQAPRVAPPPGVLEQGFTPQSDLPAEYLNYLIGTHAERIAGIEAGTLLFGHGSDGDVTLDGVVAAPAWATKLGTVYTAFRNV